MMMQKEKTVGKAKTVGTLFSGNDLKKLIFPLIIEQILAVSVGMVDTMMVSSAGEAATSGVSLVDIINVLIINIFAAVATGGAVVASQYLGQKRKDRACQSADQLILVTGVVALVIMTLSILFRWQLLNLIYKGVTAEVMKNAVIYLTISAISYPFLAVYNSCAALFRAMGNSRISMLTSLVMNVINIGGNAILIFGLHRKVEGVAIPSLVSRAVAAVIMMILIRNPELPVHTGRKLCLRFDRKMIGRILGIGVPSGMESCFFNLGKIMVLSIISAFGTTQIAANAVANNVDNVCCIPGNAMGLAMITVIGQCVGAGDVEQVKYYTKKLMKITYVTMSSLIIVILLSQPLIFRMYNLSPETMALAKILMSMHNITALFLWPLAFTFPNMLRSCNDVAYTMVVSIVSMCVGRILFGFILGKYMGYGAIGVCAAMLLDWVFRLTFFLIRYFRGNWKKTMFRYAG